MGMLELSTAVRHKLPLVVVILNDNCYGAEYQKLADLGLATAHSEVAWPEFADLARSLGAAAVTVRHAADFAAAGAAIAAGAYPLLIDVKADAARRRPTSPDAQESA